MLKYVAVIGAGFVFHVFGDKAMFHYDNDEIPG
jgi:hypothetical protein